MFIPVHESQKVLRYIFNEGCILCEDNIETIHEPTGVKNLAVMSITRSLTDKGHLKRVFVWRHGYYYLTESGLVALREKLAIPSNIVPKTFASDFLKEDENEDEKIDMAV
ncbi:hypothetical protein EDEG_02301 [Edhazardia aedis USNM 41457]|uniref:Plectin/eS10 N-terminal domain-containing protein n=1 Tax=Edhazardia aedis (strain USNM 41457) TaxID=1003232 RepID=J9D733_EDHAE|nr:hypothetical protein EDEG_02301 [Edhazardia aedis USNM 41457]|eukprot:EJW03344.1 hypothetical protein EDEG_02301 [Edhazardia aedis USNM 41457]